MVRPKLDYLDIIAARGRLYGYYRRAGKRDAGEIPWTVTKTSKKKASPTKVVIPLHSDLVTELAQPLPVESMYLICGARGHQLSRFAVSQGMRRECFRLGIGVKNDRGKIIKEPPPVHGLRKSAIMRLIEAGAKPRQIQVITGQSLQMIEHYGKDYERPQLAQAAILKLERFTDRSPRNGR